MGSTGGRRRSPSEWHLQDWLLCIEALASITHPEETTPRQRRAWRLLEMIAAACRIDPTEYVFEIDDSWGPETAVPSADPSITPSQLLDDRDWTLLAEALSTFAEHNTHTKRGQRACQLAAMADDDCAVADH